MSSSDLIEFHANALALALLIQAKAKGEGSDKSEGKKNVYPRTHEEYLNQPLTKVTRQGIWKMVDERMEGGHLYRIDRLEKTVESYGVRIAQLEANQKPPQLN